MRLPPTRFRLAGGETDLQPGGRVVTTAPRPEVTPGSEGNPRTAGASSRLDPGDLRDRCLYLDASERRARRRASTTAWLRFGFNWLITGAFCCSRLSDGRESTTPGRSHRRAGTRGVSRNDQRALGPGGDLSAVVGAEWAPPAKRKPPRGRLGKRRVRRFSDHRPPARTGYQFVDVESHSHLRSPDPRPVAGSSRSSL